jgi:hypothetical protein
VSPPVAGAALRARHAEAAPLRLPPAPRRVSGPSRHPRATPAAPAARPSLLLRLVDHPLLERLVRGRAWIAIVATALLGIVAMQVALLRIGAEIGSATSAVNALTAQNETTQTELAVLEAGHRLGRAAASLDMVYPAPGAVSYLQANDGDAARAARMMTVPSSAAIAAAAADATRPVTVAPATPPPSTTPADTPSTTTPAAGSGASSTTAAGTAAGTSAGGTTGAGTPTAGTTTAGTTTAGTTTAGTTTAGTTTAGTTTAGTTTAGTTTAGTTAAGTAAAGTTAAGTTAAGTSQTQASGTAATTPSGTATAPSTTAAGGTTPGG